MNTNKSKIVFQASAKDFEKIPGCIFAYWVDKITVSHFSNTIKLAELGESKQGLITANNNRFLKLWHEISLVKKQRKWFHYNKGGGFRKWFGYREYLVNWDNNGYEICHYFDKNGTLLSRPQNIDFYFMNSITWSDISTSPFCSRIIDNSFIFDASGPSFFPATPSDIYKFLCLLNSIVSQHFLKVICQGMHFSTGHIPLLPVDISKSDVDISQTCIHISRTDWDNYETSWDFERSPLLAASQPHVALSEVFDKVRRDWIEATSELHRLEEENNRIFIEAYGLQEELTPEVSWDEITLTCNPWYRYGVTPPNPTCKEFPVDDALEARMKADTMKEFLSYAVGCMFGRYSLDKPGLVLANQGETLADYLRQIPQPTFRPDEDNVLPILDEDWFADDIVMRFYEFLKTTFGEETFYENLAFIEDALGKDVRSFFLKDFYKDHLQRYHNRPIYWLFSSPKGAFNALVYMHRYRPETVGMVLTYLRSHITKVTERIHTLEITIDSPDATTSMKSKAIRECAKLQKSLQELEDYERDVLYPLATEKIDLDLDDGVKVNYRKFGNALFKVKGLETKED